METISLVISIIQSMGISLGVGASTMAVLHFFYAIKDGTITVDERNFLGVTYLVLRVAMGIILSSLIILAILGYTLFGEDYFTGYNTAQAILTSVLFINAYLMTVHVMPSTFGPAIQASSWYSLGFLMSLSGQGLGSVNIFIFLFAYGTVIFFAISLINSVMAYLKEKREQALIE